MNKGEQRTKKQSLIPDINPAMKRIPVLLVCLFLLFGCNSGKLPEGVIDEKKMINVLTDLSVMDGYMSTLTYTDTLRGQGQNLYASIYKKHDISKAIFDKSMKYYATQPVALDSMYSKVTRRLDAKEKKVFKTQTLKEIQSAK